MPPRSGLGPRSSGLGYSGLVGPNQLGQPHQTGQIPGGSPIPGAAGTARIYVDANDPRLKDMALARRAQILGFQEYIPQTGVDDNQGDPQVLNPGWSDLMRTPLDPGIDMSGYVNPYRTVMYSVTGLSTTIPTRAIIGNLRRSYLLIQNTGPGNLFVGIGTDPNGSVAGSSNVLVLVATQVYEQIGGGFFLPPNPWYPDGVSMPFSFCSSEYISLMVDNAATNAMILEGTWSPPRPGSQRISGGA